MVAPVTQDVDLDRKVNEAYQRELARRSRRSLQGVLCEREKSFSDDEPDPVRSSLASLVEQYAGESDLFPIIMCLPPNERATQDFSVPLRELFVEDSIDWDRWHELRDIREERALTRDEETEYEWFARIVSRLDAEEEAIAARAVEALVKKHERVIASLERLTEAVKAAAERA